MFARRTSRKKLGKEEEEVILKKPPPTLQERLKTMEEGVDMVNFKVLKYDSRIVEEKKIIEDMVMAKMGKWKYSPEQFGQDAPKSLMRIVQKRWNFSR